MPAVPGHDFKMFLQLLVSVRFLFLVRCQVGPSFVCLVPLQSVDVRSARPYTSPHVDECFLQSTVMRLYGAREGGLACSAVVQTKNSAFGAFAFAFIKWKRAQCRFSVQINANIPPTLPDDGKHRQILSHTSCKIDIFNL